MRIAAYQFDVTGNIQRNLEMIKRAIQEASVQGVDLLVFPECAVTGYPPRNIPDSKAVDHQMAASALHEIQELVDHLGICVIVGTIVYDGAYYNRACFLSPSNPLKYYDKRALYGWDEENFETGTEEGVFQIGEYKIGVRICFEVRFPEYFRELYIAKTDLNVVQMYDVADEDSKERYEMIRGHLITRAVENVTPILSVNAIGPYQTAPTCFIDASGKVLSECKKQETGMLIYEFSKKELNFGEKGRKRYSDLLLGIEN